MPRAYLQRIFMATAQRTRNRLSYAPVLVMTALFLAGAGLKATTPTAGDAPDVSQSEPATPPLPPPPGGRSQPAPANGLELDPFMMPSRARDLDQDEMALLAQLAVDLPELLQGVAALDPDQATDFLRALARLQAIAAGQQVAPQAPNDDRGGPDRDPRAGTAPV
jgi:hypothetical protein